MPTSFSTLIDHYAAGGSALRPAIASLTRDDCLARPGPGDWSIQELVIHLADSDQIAADRMKRVIAEDNPTIIGFNESLFIANLFSDEQSLDDAVTVFEANRRQMTRILRRLDAAAFTRTGSHNEAGTLTLTDLLRIYIDHLEHHLTFLFQKRERLGKPMG
ncbi:MAG: DinB family protein [Phycisphaeraceae bacterium]